DRIAFGLGLLKAASDDRAVGGAALAARLSVTAPPALDAGDWTLSKAARTRMQVASLLAESAPLAAKCAAYDGGLARDPLGAVPAAPAPLVFRALSDAGAVLGVADWLALCVGKEASAAAAAEVAPFVRPAFARLAADPDLPRKMADCP